MCVRQRKREGYDEHMGDEFTCAVRRTHVPHKSPLWRMWKMKHSSVPTDDRRGGHDAMGDPTRKMNEEPSDIKHCLKNTQSMIKEGLMQRCVNTIVQCVITQLSLSISHPRSSSRDSLHSSSLSYSWLSP